MGHERPPLLLRPIHTWFFLWEDIVPSMYRVVAVAGATGITAAVLAVIFRVHWLVALVLATAGWIALAIAQEHDGRVTLDVDGDFLLLLRRRADAVLSRAGFTFSGAFGPCRARRDRTDTFLYEAAVGPQGKGCVDLWIHRDRFGGGRLVVLVDGNPLERLVASRGDPQLAARVGRREEATGDVSALVAAFELVLPEQSR